MRQLRWPSCLIRRLEWARRRISALRWRLKVPAVRAALVPIIAIVVAVVVACGGDGQSEGRLTQTPEATVDSPSRPSTPSPSGLPTPTPTPGGTPPPAPR